MGKPLTYRKNGELGIEGVDLSALPPQVYGALAKLCDLENPILPNNADVLRASNDEEMADVLSGAGCPPGSPFCGGEIPCEKCWVDWLKSPAEEAQNEQ